MRLHSFLKSKSKIANAHSYTKDLRVLEENVEQSLEREEQALDAQANRSADGTSADSQIAIRELKVRSESLAFKHNLFIISLID